MSENLQQHLEARVSLSPEATGTLLGKLAQFNETNAEPWLVEYAQRVRKEIKDAHPHAAAEPEPDQRVNEGVTVKALDLWNLGLDEYRQN